jgi:hypothetical protein
MLALANVRLELQGEECSLTFAVNVGRKVETAARTNWRWYGLLLLFLFYWRRRRRRDLKRNGGSIPFFLPHCSHDSGRACFAFQSHTHCPS